MPADFGACPSRSPRYSKKNCTTRFATPAIELKSRSRTVRIEQNFSGQTAFQHFESFGEFAQRQPLSEQRLQIQLACFQQLGHLHPGFEHEPAKNSMDCGALENNVIHQI